MIKIFIHNEKFIFYKRYINNLLYNFNEISIIIIEELCNYKLENWHDYIIKYINDNLNNIFIFFDFYDEQLFKIINKVMYLPLYLLNISIPLILNEDKIKNKFDSLFFIHYFEDNKKNINESINKLNENFNYILHYSINNSEIFLYNKSYDICLIFDSKVIKQTELETKINHVIKDLKINSINKKNDIIKYYDISKINENINELYQYKIIIVMDSNFYEINYIHFILNNCILLIDDQQKCYQYEDKIIYFNLNNLKLKIISILNNYSYLYKTLFPTYFIDNINKNVYNNYKLFNDKIIKYHQSNSNKYKKMINMTDNNIENIIENIIENNNITENTIENIIENNNITENIIENNNITENIIENNNITENTIENIIENNTITENTIENNTINENNNIIQYPIAFIILRHVNNEKVNLLWKTNIKNIRKYYDYPIFIIDDNSNYDFIDQTLDQFENCYEIKSEFKKRGEILPYYYLYHKKLCHKAIIIHDGTFINQFIDFINIKEPISYLWHFTHDWNNEEEELKLLSIIENKNLINFYHQKEWFGCFGVQTVIDYIFLESIFKKYNFQKLMDYIDSRPIRMNFERIFSVICTYEYNELFHKKSLYGIIHHYIHWGYNYEKYILDSEENKISNYPLIKIWNGR